MEVWKSGPGGELYMLVAFVLDCMRYVHIHLSWSVHMECCYHVLDNG